MNRSGDFFEHDALFGRGPPNSGRGHPSYLKDFLLHPNSLNGLCYNDPRANTQQFGYTNNNVLQNNLVSPNFGNGHHVGVVNNFIPSYNMAAAAYADNSLLPGAFGDQTHHAHNRYSIMNSSLLSTLPQFYNSPISNLQTSISELLMDNALGQNSEDLLNACIPPISDHGTLPDSLLIDDSNLDKSFLSQTSSSDGVGYNVTSASYEAPAPSSYISSPHFNIDSSSGLLQTKDSDPFSPSISSNVSSVPSIELSDKMSYVPGSVDSGVVVNGSPFSVPESTKNCETSISPAQRTGSERSVETTPGSESVSSEVCSPRVEPESLAPEHPQEREEEEGDEEEEQEEVKIKDKEKNHKGRKRKYESKKEKKPKKQIQQPQMLVPTYHSQISPESNGIKLKISIKAPGPLPVGKKKKLKKATSVDYVEPEQQSAWGTNVPEDILEMIFRMCVETEGSVPFLFRMSQVCRLWREVATKPLLWRNVNLCNKYMSVDPRVNDHNFRWLCENRLSHVQDLNLGGWKFASVPYILDRICRLCPELRGLSLMGWESITADSIRYLVSNCPKLERIDLSNISSNQGCVTKSAVSLNSLLFLAEDMGERLTQLSLSNNKLTGIPQIIAALSSSCPNLQVLDLSNVTTMQATGQIHIEKLQEGCPNLRVLRITNSQVCLTPVSFKEQLTSPGFPALEELSVACVSNSLCSMTQPFVDDNSIERILKTSHKLKLLDARGCTRITDSSLVRIPAWDLTHLFLSGSFVTRIVDSGLELIAQKWSHSLVEVDFAWCSATNTIDAAVNALAEQGDGSPLRILDLTGSSVSLSPVEAILKRCHKLTSLNLTSCRGLPRGMKRLYTGSALKELKKSVSKPQESAASDEETD